jgi:dTDP-4-dehydrorhamnose 3,5-epimerase
MADVGDATAVAEAPDQTLLEQTIGAAVRDKQTVTASGDPVARGIEGVRLLPRRTLIDDRGSLVEMFDPRWGVHPDPLVYAYAFTVRPGRAKGWAIHKLHDDRYFIMFGEVEVVLYDVRPESPTCGQLARYRLSEFERSLLTIPRLVWHATRNLGDREFVGINLPTRAFDHQSPDKYRLPLDTPLIPYSFEGTPGW